ncbi:MAG: SpoIIE family protein phosphatase [Firmicutes bacterium]|nr:SpoIIE family protein phosphatase [Bacillota bacterium]
MWARASLFGEFHPFALAALASISLVHPWGLLPVLIGTIIGLASSLGVDKLPPYLLLSFLVLIGSHLARRQGGTVSYQIIFGAFYTSGAVLIGRIILATLSGCEPVFLYFAILEAVLAGLLVAILSYFGTRLKASNLFVTGMRYEETAFAVLITGIGIAGLDGVHWGLLSVQDMVLRILVITAAWLAGPGAGAVTAISAGVIVALLSDFSPYCLTALAAAGVCAGLFREMGKAGVIFGSVAGATLLSYQLLTPVELMEMASSVLGAALFIGVFPSRLIQQWAGWFPLNPVRQRGALAGEEQKLRDWVSGRLATFGDVLTELARSFAQFPQDQVSTDHPDISKLINAVSDRVCTGCVSYNRCWQDQFYCTFKNFEEVLVEAEKHGSLQVQELPVGTKRSCTQVHKLVQAVNYLLELESVESSWEKKLLASREIVSNQLQGVADVVASLAQEMQERRCVKEDPSKALLDAFLQKQCRVQDVKADLQPDGQYKIHVLCSNCGGREECRKLAPVASTVMETPFSLVKPSCGYYTGESWCELLLLPEKAYHLEYKVVEESKSGARVNGDNHLLITLPGGKIGIALSDGMGSGSKAALESSTTLSLLENLLRAGLDRQFAVRAINSLLLFRTPEESFATLDLFLFDEHTGEAEFVKIGCQPTYIVRGSEILKVEGKSLPIGILSQVDVQIITEGLYPNDYIVMITDGVKDCAPDLPGDWFEKVLENTKKQGAADFAEQLFAQCMAACDGVPQDDLTIAVARVRSKGMSDGISIYTRCLVSRA